MSKNTYIYSSTLILSLFLTSLLYGQNQKKVLVEQISGSWCGQCPAGYLIMDSLILNENVIGVYLHADDPMEIPGGFTLWETYAFGAAPSFFIDRNLFSSTSFVSFGIEKTAIDSNVLKRLNEPAQVNISFEEISIDTAIQEASVKVKGVFEENLTGDYRFNLYVVERTIQKEGNDYSQSNFFNYVEGHPYENLGGNIPNFIFKDVVSAMLGDTWGIPESIPSNNIQAGDEFEYTFSFDWADDWALDNIDLIVLVQKYDENNVNNRSILNSNKTHFSDWIQEETDVEIGIEKVNSELPAYYDYTSQNIQIRLPEAGNNSATLFNIGGQILKEISFQNNTKTLPVSDLSPGVYFLSIETEQGIFSGSIAVF